jgi:hypothetical protein
MNTLTEDGIKSIGNGDTNYYIYKSKSGDVGFIQIEEEISQLNNYCWLITNGVDEKLNSLKNNLNDAQLNPNKIIGNGNFGGVANSDIVDGLEQFVLPQWEDTKKFVLPATCIVLTYIFVEKSLKHLCNYFSEENSLTNKIKQGAGQSKVEASIEFIKNNFFPNLTIDNEIWDLLKKAQTVRNSYAHGDWDDIRQEIQSIDIVSIFDISSKLFYEIEKEQINLKKKKNTQTTT